jgi:hypothetical protein
MMYTYGFNFRNLQTQLINTKFSYDDSRTDYVH